jgi:hypothetical protein
MVKSVTLQMNSKNKNLREIKKNKEIKKTEKKSNLRGANNREII